MYLGHAHLRARKRLYKNLPAYPHPNRFRRYFDTLMLCVGSLAPLALLPQVVALYEAKDATGFSLITWPTLALINILWATYGLLHKETPIFVANAGMALLNIAIVVGIVLY